MTQDLLHFLLPVHSLLRWVILVLLLIAVINAASGMNSNKAFRKQDRSIILFLMIATHLNFLIGLYQWFVSALGLNAIRSMGFGAVMKSGLYRFWAIEHITGMLIAVILITVANATTKKNLIDRVKFRKIFWLLLIALILILASIPWPFREEIARPWIRGF
jgi:hypothetical protein